MAKNADSALKLGQARGVAIVAAVNQELPVFEYAARQVKQTVVGIGSRKASAAYNTPLLKLPANPQADAADALAIAITHCHVSQNAMQMSESRLNLGGEGDCDQVIPPRSVPAEAFPLPPHESTQTRMMPQTGWRDGFTLPRNRTREPEFPESEFCIRLLFNNFSKRLYFTH